MGTDVHISERARYLASLPNVHQGQPLLEVNPEEWLPPLHVRRPAPQWPPYPHRAVAPPTDLVPPPAADGVVIPFRGNTPPVYESESDDEDALAERGG